MTELIIFKVFVRPTAKCLSILRYLNKNITTVNRLGAGVRVEKIGNNEIDEELLDLFRKKGITRLPALLAPDGKVFIGLQQIMDVFNKNMNSAHNMQRVSPLSGDIGTNPDLSDFYMKEMFAGKDKDGKYIPRKDKDDREDEGADIEKRMADYGRNPPRHRVANVNHERDVTAPTRERRAVRRHDEDDNIADSDRDESPPRPPRKAHGPRNVPMAPGDDMRGDDMDSRMLAAWMDKTPPTEEY